MALSSAVQGATHTPQAITWLDGDDNPQDLTGATLTAKKRLGTSGQVSDITGTLSVVDPATNGVFTWEYSEEDVETAGDYFVQFTATYDDDTNDKTIIEAWTVEDELGSEIIPFTYTLLDSVSAAPIAHAKVTVTSDVTGITVVAYGETDTDGEIVFHLHAGTYYLWRQKSGYSFANPDTEVVA